MMAAKFMRLLLLGFAAVWATLPQTVAACSACFGKSDSAMAKGMNMGILALLLVVTFVLSGFAAFMIYLIKRSALVENSPPDNTITQSNPLHS